MATEALATTCNITVDAALDFMAKKAGVPVASILASLVADPAGNTARYFAQLIVIGVKAADAI